MIGISMPRSLRVVDLLVAGQAHARRASARRPRAPGRGRGPRRRTGPGRCPCRCSRARPRRRPRAARPRPAAARSAVGRARSPAGTTPWYSASAWSARQTYWLTNVSRASTTYALAAPADIARRSTPSRSEPPPTSTVRVTTSTRVLLPQPGDGDGGVQAAGVGEHDLVHRASGLRERGSARRLEGVEPVEPAFQGRLVGEQHDQRVVAGDRADLLGQRGLVDRLAR